MIELENGFTLGDLFIFMLRRAHGNSARKLASWTIVTRANDDLQRPVRDSKIPIELRWQVN